MKATREEKTRKQSLEGRIETKLEKRKPKKVIKEVNEVKVQHQEKIIEEKETIKGNNEREPENIKIQLNLEKYNSEPEVKLVNKLEQQPSIKPQVQGKTLMNRNSRIISSEKHNVPSFKENDTNSQYSRNNSNRKSKQYLAI